MKNSRLKPLILILIVSIIAFACPILMRDPILMDSQEQILPDVFFSSYIDHGSYKFDPTTILDVIKHGNTDVFTLTTESSGDHIYDSPFPWKQSDYLTIANAIHQFVWEETVDKWDLHDMAFYGDCRAEVIGFDNAIISFYKLTGLQEISAHMIGIYPPAGEGEWGGGSGFSHSLFSQWNYIDSRKLLPVEDALRIADENGGELARLSVSNRCTIDLLLGPYPYPQWRVSYFLNGSTKTLFEITIDAYSQYLRQI